MNTAEVIDAVRGEILPVEWAEMRAEHAANRVVIHYAFPTSSMAYRLGSGKTGGFYVTIGHSLPVSELFQFLSSAEGFCRNNGLTWEPHQFPV